MSYADRMRTYRASRYRTLAPIIGRINDVEEDARLSPAAKAKALKPLRAEAEAACRTFETLAADTVQRAEAAAAAAVPATELAAAAAGNPERAAALARVAEFASPDACLRLAKSLQAGDAGGFGLVETLARRAGEPGFKDAAPAITTVLAAPYQEPYLRAVADFVLARHELARAHMDVDGLTAPSNVQRIVAEAYAASGVALEGAAPMSLTTQQVEALHASFGLSPAAPECELPALLPGALATVVS